MYQVSEILCTKRTAPHRIAPLMCCLSSLPLNINDGERSRFGLGHCYCTCTFGHRAGPTSPTSIESISVVLTCCSMGPQGSFTFLLQNWTTTFSSFEQVFLHVFFITKWSYSWYLFWRLLRFWERLHSCWCKLERHSLALSLPTGWHWQRELSPNTKSH